MLLVNICVREIYIRWNKITSCGGILIFEGLLENENITVFDISWNLLHKIEFEKEFRKQMALIPKPPEPEETDKNSKEKTKPEKKKKPKKKKKVILEPEITIS